MFDMSDDVAKALIASRDMTAWTPSLRDRIAYALASGLEAVGGDRNGQQRVIAGAKNVMDFIPGLGEVLGADDTVRAARSGNYGEAALNGAATLAGVVPLIGDVAGGAIKRMASKGGEWASYPYHRFTSGPSPDNGVGYMMFANGSPSRVEGYGSSHWVTGDHMYPPGSVIDSTDDKFTESLSAALRKHDENGTLPNGYYGDQIDDIVSSAAPRDIVDSAGIWDSDLVDLIYSDVLQPNGWLGVKTPDGFISFDEGSVKRFTGDWTDHWK